MHIRPRVVWSKLWQHISQLFEAIGTHPNILIAIPTNIIDKVMGTLIYDQTSFILFTSFMVFMTIYGYLMFSEIAGRVFVFFHVPQKLDEYL